MTPNKAVTDDFRVLSRDDILRIHPLLPYRTSCRYHWPGIEVHRYGSVPRDTHRESPVRAFPQLTLFLAHTRKPFMCDVTIGDLKLRREIRNGAVSIAPPHLAHKVQGDRSSGREATLVFISPALIANFAVQLTGIETPEILPQIGIDDPLLSQLIGVLDRELTLESPSPILYVESLTATLCAHILTKYAVSPLRGEQPRTLHRLQLSRAIGFMKEHLSRNLTLEELASCAAMSKYHFAKSFKLSVGIAPHQYLTRLRMEEGRKSLQANKLSIEEIAHLVGYGSREHFVAQFRRQFGVTPSQYRRFR